MSLKTWSSHKRFQRMPEPFHEMGMPFNFMGCLYPSAYGPHVAGSVVGSAIWRGNSKSWPDGPHSKK